MVETLAYAYRVARITTLTDHVGEQTACRVSVLKCAGGTNSRVMVAGWSIVIDTSTLPHLILTVS